MSIYSYTIRSTWAKLTTLVCVLLTCGFVFGQVALAEDIETTEAQAYEIVDGNGNVIAEKNAEVKMDPASITKIMTAVVALDTNPDMNATINIVDEEFPEAAQLIGWTSSDHPTFYEVIMGMLIYSGNDAADQVAIHVAGSIDAFVEKMNAKAQELGMTNTHFVNPHGLTDVDHYTTAHDLCILARYAYQNYPFIRQAVRTRSIELTVGGQTRTYKSTDSLMETYSGLLGMKTGMVESGTTFMGASSRGGVYLFSAVLGCKTSEGRFTDTAILMDWAYQNYYHKKVYGLKNWIVRIQNYAYNFAFKTLVQTESDAVGYIEPRGDVTYSTTLVNSSLLLDANSPAGYIAYTQNKRLVATSTYRASLVFGTKVPKTLFDPLSQS